MVLNRGVHVRGRCGPSLLSIVWVPVCFASLLGQQPTDGTSKSGQTLPSDTTVARPADAPAAQAGGAAPAAPASAPSVADPAAAPPAVQQVRKRHLQEGRWRYRVSPASREGVLRELLRASGTADDDGLLSLRYKIVTAEDGQWKTVVSVAMQEESVEYVILSDGVGGVLSERETRSGGVDNEESVTSETTVDKVNERLLGDQKRISYRVVPDERAGRTAGKASAAGRDDATTEVLIPPDEPVTTLFGLPVFVACLDTVPLTGINFRWVVGGRPVPVLVRQRNRTKGGAELEVLRQHPTKEGDKGPIAVVTLDLRKDPGQFSMPRKISLLLEAGTIDLELVGTSENSPSNGRPAR